MSKTLNREAVLYGFVGWLTTRNEAVTMSEHHDASEPANLVGAYLDSLGLTDDPEYGEDYPGSVPAEINMIRRECNSPGHLLAYEEYAEYTN